MTEPTQLPDVGGHVTPGQIIELMDAMPVGTVIWAAHDAGHTNDPSELHWTKEEEGNWRCWENEPGRMRWISGRPDNFRHHQFLYVQSYPEPEPLDWVPIPSEAIMAGMTVKLSTSPRACYIHTVEGRDAYGVYKDQADAEWQGNNGQLARFRLSRDSDWGIVANPEAHIAEEVSRRIAEPIEQLPFDITSRDDLGHVPDGGYVQSSNGIVWQHQNGRWFCRNVGQSPSLYVGQSIPTTAWRLPGSVSWRYVGMEMPPEPELTTGGVIRAVSVGPVGAIYTQEDVDRMIAEARAQWLADLTTYLDRTE